MIRFSGTKKSESTNTLTHQRSATKKTSHRRNCFFTSMISTGSVTWMSCSLQLWWELQTDCRSRQWAARTSRKCSFQRRRYKDSGPQRDHLIKRRTAVLPKYFQQVLHSGLQRQMPSTGFQLFKIKLPNIQKQTGQLAFIMIKLFITLVSLLSL